MWKALFRETVLTFLAVRVKISVGFLRSSCCCSLWV